MKNIDDKILFKLVEEYLNKFYRESDDRIIGLGGVTGLTQPAQWYRDFAKAVMAEAEPQPSVPSGMCLVNAGALQMVINALRRDEQEGKTTRGEMADELLATVRECDAQSEESEMLEAPTDMLETARVELEMLRNARDAERYRWLIDYLISDRVDLDDAIVAARTSEDIANVIDAAIAAAKEMK